MPKKIFVTGGATMLEVCSLLILEKVIMLKFLTHYILDTNFYKT